MSTQFVLQGYLQHSHARLYRHNLAKKQYSCSSTPHNILDNRVVSIAGYCDIKQQVRKPSEKSNTANINNFSFCAKGNLVMIQTALIVYLIVKDE